MARSNPGIMEGKIFCPSSIGYGRIDMSKRVISGIVIAVLAVVLGLCGGIPLGLVLAVCALLGYYELTRALGVHDESKEKSNLLEITGLVAGAFYYAALICCSQIYGNYDGGGNLLVRGSLDPLPYIHVANALMIVTVAAVFFVNMTVYVLTFPRYQASQVIGSVFSFLYAPILISCIYRAQFLPYGKFVYALMFFCAWICDTCAWAAGRAFGKHKMTPILSPHKTIEGAVGGVLGGTILCVLAARLAAVLVPGENLYAAFAVIGVAGSFIGMAGDLAASAIKRNHGIKDYGKVIPGHGGIMDRFDSIIFTAPVIYALGVLFLAVLR